MNITINNETVTIGCAANSLYEELQRYMKAWAHYILVWMPPAIRDYFGVIIPREIKDKTTSERLIGLIVSIIYATLSAAGVAILTILSIFLLVIQKITTGKSYKGKRYVDAAIRASRITAKYCYKLT